VIQNKKIFKKINNMNTKKFSTLHFPFLILLLLFAACGKKDNPPAPNPNPVVPELALTGFSPAEARFDEVVTITGTGFSTTAANNAVTFNGVTATVTAATATQLKVTVPKSKTATGKINVMVASKTVSSATDFTYLLTYTVSTIAGDGTGGFQDGNIIVPAGQVPARFNNPIGIAVVNTGSGGNAGVTVYVGDSYNMRIRKFFIGGITAGGTVSTLAGDGTTTVFNTPCGVAVDKDGNVYVADWNNHRIRKVTSTGTVSTLAGSNAGLAGFGFADNTGTAARFNYPYGLAVAASGDVFVADGFNHRIRKITSSGAVSTFAGSTDGFNDATGTSAKFFYPMGVAIDAAGNLYITDGNNYRIRKISADGVVTTLAGSGSGGFNDGAGAGAKFDFPRGIAVTASGDVFVADWNNHRIRKITPAGVVSTVAGSQQGFFDGTGTAAKFDSPAGIALDAAGNIYVADQGNHRIRKIVAE
jgi:sugar lactone lactonase YvrE